MCGRYANHIEDMKGWSTILSAWPSNFDTGFNISPTQMIPVVMRDGVEAMRWGLIAHWSREVSNKYATFNARVESVADKPTFRHAWSKGQHCLIPALGYYEWRTESDGKQPYFVRPKSNEPMVFAGLYEPERSDEFPASCTILTQPATTKMARLHPRMPVILSQKQAEIWLEANTVQAQSECLHRTVDALSVYAVDRKVNNSSHQGSELVQAIDPSD